MVAIDAINPAALCRGPVIIIIIANTNTRMIKMHVCINNGVGCLPLNLGFESTRMINGPDEPTARRGPPSTTNIKNIFKLPVK